MKHTIAVTTNNREIYAYLTQGPLATNVARNPHLLTLVKEVVAPLNLTLPAVTIEQDMGRNIGYSDQLETGEKDAIFYARQTHSAEYTRFVKHRKSDHTSFLSLRLQADDTGGYELTNAWIGKLYPPVPTSEQATEQSKNYWETHAVVFNGQPLLASTITKTCPY